MNFLDLTSGTYEVLDLKFTLINTPIIVLQMSRLCLSDANSIVVILM